MVFDPTTGDPYRRGPRSVRQERAGEYCSRCAPRLRSCCIICPCPTSGRAFSTTSFRLEASTSTTINTMAACRLQPATLLTHVFAPLYYRRLQQLLSRRHLETWPADRPHSTSRATPSTAIKVWRSGFDHAFSPLCITDCRFGFYRYRIRVQPNGVGTTPATDAGLPGLNTGIAGNQRHASFLCERQRRL